MGKGCHLQARVTLCSKLVPLLKKDAPQVSPSNNPQQKAQGRNGSGERVAGKYVHVSSVVSALEWHKDGAQGLPLSYIPDLSMALTAPLTLRQGWVGQRC